MKKLLFFLLISIISVSAFSDDKVSKTDTTSHKAVVCQKLKDSGATPEQLAKRGCCSWHSGVCGCSGGRAVCCDGQFSPSCTCHKEDAPDEIKG